MEEEEEDVYRQDSPPFTELRLSARGACICGHQRHKPSRTGAGRLLPPWLTARGSRIPAAARSCETPEAPQGPGTIWVGWSRLEAARLLRASRHDVGWLEVSGGPALLLRASRHDMGCLVSGGPACLLRGAGLRRCHAKASWAYLFRMIKLLSCSSSSSCSSGVCRENGKWKKSLTGQPGDFGRLWVQKATACRSLSAFG